VKRTAWHNFGFGGKCVQWLWWLRNCMEVILLCRNLNFSIFVLKNEGPVITVQKVFVQTWILRVFLTLRILTRVSGWDCIFACILFSAFFYFVFFFPTILLHAWILVQAKWQRGPEVRAPSLTWRLSRMKSWRLNRTL